MDMDLNDTDAPLGLESGLPRLYELIALGQVDSAVQQASRRADAGAEEGMLVYARSQTDAQGRCGQEWLSPAGGLYAALVLRPDEPAAIAAQLGVVGAVALGSAVAEHVLPLTELHFRWPNDLLLRQGKVGSIQLRWRGSGSGALDWLVLGVNVNVTAPPSMLGFDAASVQVDGGCAVTAAQLLVSFARQFLVWVDRWVNEGFDPVRKAWLQRAVGVGEAFEIAAAGKRHSGRLLGIADDGGLLLGRGGAVDRISLSEAFAWMEPCTGS